MTNLSTSTPEIVDPLAFERIYLARQGILENPLWFDAVSGGSVIAGVALGALLHVFYGSKEPLRSVSRRAD